MLLAGQRMRFPFHELSILLPVALTPTRMQVFPLQLLQSLLSGFAQKVRLLIFMLLVVQHKPFTFHELVTLQPACLALIRRLFSFVQPRFSATLFK